MTNSDHIAQILNEKLAPIAVYLFGSRATGDARADSDTDLAVLCRPEAIPSFEEQLALRVALSEVTQGDVDLIILNESGPIIAMQAVTKGKPILENNRLEHQLYLTRLFAQYAEFKELRAPMEKNILKRRYYGR